ncbi:hypothetical protein [Corynebacterium sp.]|uniref:hypothetical protein n=1 Tax=Corynebacterium sp. TaxID=1720 RepID=UPI003B3A4BE4
MDIAIGDSGRTLTLPGHWQELDTVPEDAPGTVAFGYRTAGSFAAVTLAPLDGQMMPVDRDDVITGIRPALEEAQAELVDVDAGETPSGDLLVYTIVRTPEPEEGEGAGDGDQLNLTLHFAVENGDYMAPYMVQGFLTGEHEEALDQARDLVTRIITAE